MAKNSESASTLQVIKEIGQQPQALNQLTAFYSPAEGQALLSDRKSVV
jgi:hypothetical protein